MKYLSGAQNVLNGVDVVDTDQDMTLDEYTDITSVSGLSSKPGDISNPGFVTLRMPLSPRAGEVHSVLAAGANVLIDGNGNALALSAQFVPNGSSLDITFSIEKKEWVGICCA